MLGHADRVFGECAMSLRAELPSRQTGGIPPACLLVHSHSAEILDKRAHEEALASSPGKPAGLFSRSARRREAKPIDHRKEARTRHNSCRGRHEGSSTAFTSPFDRTRDFAL